MTADADQGFDRMSRGEFCGPHEDVM